MKHYAGIDVSLEQSSVCVVDGDGTISMPSLPMCVARGADGGNSARLNGADGALGPNRKAKRALGNHSRNEATKCGFVDGELPS